MYQLSTIINISQILEKNQHTYNDVEEILRTLMEHYKTVRECIEYDTVQDLKNNIKKIDAGNMKVKKINDVMKYINRIADKE